MIYISLFLCWQGQIPEEVDIGGIRHIITRCLRPSPGVYNLHKRLKSPRVSLAAAVNHQISFEKRNTWSGIADCTCSFLPENFPRHPGKVAGRVTEIPADYCRQQAPIKDITRLGQKGHWGHTEVKLKVPGPSDSLGMLFVRVSGKLSVRLPWFTACLFPLFCRINCVTESITRYFRTISCNCEKFPCFCLNHSTSLFAGSDTNSNLSNPVFFVHGHCVLCYLWTTCDWCGTSYLSYLIRKTRSICKGKSIYNTLGHIWWLCAHSVIALFLVCVQCAERSNGTLIGKVNNKSKVWFWSAYIDFYQGTVPRWHIQWSYKVIDF